MIPWLVAAPVPLVVWAQTTVRGNHNVVVDAKNSTVTVHRGTENVTFKYNNQYGLNDSEIEQFVAQIVGASSAEVLKKTSLIVRKLDKLGKLKRDIHNLSVQVDSLDQDVLAGNQAAAAEGAKTAAELSKQLQDLKARLAQQMQGWKQVIVQNQDREAKQTQQVLNEIAAQADQARQAHLHEEHERVELKTGLQLGWLVEFRNAHFKSTRQAADANLTAEFYRITPCIAVGANLGGLVGQYPTTQEYQDPAGQTLQQSSSNSAFFAFQFGGYLRAFRTAPVSLVVLIDARYWLDISGSRDTNHTAAAWAFPVYLGPEFRVSDADSLGLAFTADAETRATTSIRQYTGVGAQTKPVKGPGEWYLGAEAYAKFGN